MLVSRFEGVNLIFFIITEIRRDFMKKTPVLTAKEAALLRKKYPGFFGGIKRKGFVVYKVKIR
jgi:hypothetical protein